MEFGERHFSSNYIKLCYGIETSADTTNLLEVAMDLLNKSEYLECLNVLNKIKGGIDTIYWHSGFYALILPDTNIHSFQAAKIGKGDPMNYLSFRYNNFIGDITNDEQALLLLSSVDEDKQAELFRLQYVEGDALYDRFRTADSIGSKIVVESALKLKKIYPESKRLDFLLATSYLKIGDEHTAIPIIENLIHKNYYSLPCLKIVIDYYDKIGNVLEKNKYVGIFKEKFPSHCLITELNSVYPTDLVYENCRNCLKNGTQRDSVNAGIYLAKYSLSRRDFFTVDSLIQRYTDNVKFIHSYDSLRIHERLAYFEIKLQSLFLQKMYVDTRKFYLKSDEGTQTEIQFRNKIKSLYIDFVSRDTSSFSLFYDKNFATGN